MNYLEVVGTSLLRHTPELLGWLVGVILALRMLKRGGGKAEKLFLAGCSLMLVIQLVSPFLSGFAWWLSHEQGMRRALASVLAVSLPMGVLGLAGFVCLVYAFWLKFWTRKRRLA